MSETVELRAFERDAIGKTSRRLAHQGQLPAVVYGAHQAALPLALDRHDAELLLTREGVGGLIVRLGIEGRAPIDTVVKSVQTNPTKGFVQHVDFLAVRMDEAITTQAPLHFVGESEGVRAGGVLAHNVQALHIEALPKDLPESIEVDVSALGVGDSLAVADIAVPKGVTVLDDPELVLCSITAPTLAPTPEESAAAPEPEEISGSEEES